ncbi:hypothetical protein [Microbacterium xanthum]|nr:hypothetical protein [Microbacterium sp. KSW-48]MDZ8170847.1 hypothetical protein [Microbacterium sp. KSW-48]
MNRDLLSTDRMLGAGEQRARMHRRIPPRRNGALSGIGTRDYGQHYWLDY